MPTDLWKHDLHDNLEQPAAAARLALALLDRIGFGVVAVNPEGRLWHANRAARRGFSQGGVLRLEGAVLRCPPSLQDDWLKLLQDASLRQRSRMAWLGQGRHRQLLVATPLPLDGSSTPLVLVLLGRSGLCSTMGIEMLADGHGLTPGERRVLTHLVHHRDARQIAASHGVAVATIRAQIQRIRLKLGAQSVQALLLHAAELPPVDAAH